MHELWHRVQLQRSGGDPEGVSGVWGVMGKAKEPSRVVAFGFGFWLGGLTMIGINALAGLGWF